MAGFDFRGFDRDGPDDAVADRDLRVLDSRGLAIERSDWRLRSEIKAYGGISTADAAAVALACDRGATLVVGADEDFSDLPVGVDVRRFRNDGV